MSAAVSAARVFRGAGLGWRRPFPADPTVDTFEVQARTISSPLRPDELTLAPDGRVFVVEQSGIIKTFDSVDDPTSTISADLRSEVRHTGEHGLAGVTVDRAYPTRPFVYVAYSWDSTGYWGDGCAANSPGTDVSPSRGWQS